MKDLSISVAAALFLTSAIAAGAECGKDQPTSFTKAGRITESFCKEGNYWYTEYKLDGKTIYKATYPSMTSNEEGPLGASAYLIISVDDRGPNNSCPDHLALLDFTGPKPKAFHFGVKRGCSVFVASLLRRGTLYIRLDGNIKVSYKNGKFKMPDADEAMEGHMVFPGYPFDLAEIVPYVTQLHFEGTE